MNMLVYIFQSKNVLALARASNKKRARSLSFRETSCFQLHHRMHHGIHNPNGSSNDDDGDEGTEIDCTFLRSTFSLSDVHEHE